MSWNKIDTYNKEAYGSKSFNVILLNKWLNDKDIKTWSSERGHDVPKYLKYGISTSGYSNSKCNEPPYIDHAALFKATKPLKVWLVFHVYGMSEEREEKLEKWVRQNQLNITIYPDGQSWYSDVTTMIEITTID